MAELQIGIDASKAKAGSEAAKGALAELAAAAKSATDALGGIPGITSSVGTGLMSMLNPMNLIKSAWSIFSEGATSILGLLNPLTMIQSAFSLVGTAVSILSAPFQLLGSAISSAVGFMSNIAGIATGVMSVFTGLVGSVKEVATAFYEMGAKVVESFHASVEAASGFADAVTKVQAYSKGSAESFMSISKAALDIGNSTSIGATQAAAAMLPFIRSGMDAEQASTALGKALQYVEGTGADLPAAMGQISKTIKQFGLDASETGKVADIFANLTTKGMDNVIEAMGTFGNVAGTFKLNIGESFAALGLFQKAGIDAQQGVSGLRIGLEALINPSKTVSDHLSAAGIAAESVNPKMNSLASVLDVLGKSALSDEQYLEIFGNRAGPLMAALVGQGGDALRKLAGDLDQSGTAAKLAEAREQTLSEQTEMLHGRFNVFAILLGSTVQPVFFAVTKALVDFMSEINKFLVDSGAMKTATEAMATVAGVLKTGFDALKISLSPVADAAKSLVLGFVSGLKAFADWSAATASTSTVITGFKSLLESIVFSAGATVTAIQAAATGSGVLGQAWDLLTGAATTMMSKIEGLLGDYNAWILSTGSLKVAFESGVAGVQAFLSAVSGIGSTLMTAGNELATFLVGFGQFVTATNDGFKVDWTGAINHAIDGAVAAITAATPAVKSAFDVIAANAPAAFDAAYTRIVAITGQLWERYKGPINAFMNNMGNTILEKVEEVQSKLAEKFPKIASAMGLIDKAATGVAAGFRMVGEAATFYGAALGKMETDSLSVGNMMETPWNSAVASIQKDNQIILGDAMKLPSEIKPAVDNLAGVYQTGFAGMTAQARTAGQAMADGYVGGFTSSISSSVPLADGKMRSATGEIFDKWPAAAQDWGSKTAISYNDGFSDSIQDVSSQADALSVWAENIEAHSPPKKGPLSQIAVWGHSIGTSFTSAFAQAIVGGSAAVEASIDLISKSAMDNINQSISAIDNKVQSMSGKVAGTVAARSATAISQPASPSIPVSAIAPSVGESSQPTAAFSPAPVAPSAPSKPAPAVYRPNNQPLTLPAAGDYEKNWASMSREAKDAEMLRTMPNFVSIMQKGRMDSVNVSKGNVSVQVNLSNTSPAQMVQAITSEMAKRGY